MTVLNFRGHHWVRCLSRDCPGCTWCRGRLADCDRCGGAEATLPTHCPGRKLTCEELDAIWTGRIDYDEHRGGWCQKKGGRYG